MRKAKKVSKWTWLYQHRLAVFMILFLVILPIIFVPSIYVKTYLDSKPVLFSDKKADVVSVDDMPLFDIDYTITHVRLPNSDNVGGYYRFNYELIKTSGVNQISNIRVQFQLSTRWAKYSEVSTEQTVTLATMKTVQMNFNYDMDKSVLPLVKASGPTLYAKITYDELILGETYNRVIYVSLPYDLVKDNTQIIPA